MAETAPPNGDAIVNLAVKSDIVLIADRPTPKLRRKFILEVVRHRD